MTHSNSAANDILDIGNMTSFNRTLYKTPSDEFFQWVSEKVMPICYSMYIITNSICFAHSVVKSYTSPMILAISVKLYGHCSHRMRLLGLSRTFALAKASNQLEKWFISVQFFRLLCWPFYSFEVSLCPVLWMELHFILRQNGKNWWI